MTKKKSDLLKTSENSRISPYGEYYISIKKIEMFRDEREYCESSYSSPPRLPPYPQFSFGYPMLIRAVFETDKEYFAKACKQRWVHNIPLSTNAHTLNRSIYHFDVSIYFPSLTTLNIIKGKRFIRLLLEDTEICNALAYLLDTFSIKVSGNRPISALESFLRRQIVDTETKLKLQIDYPIAFEDIEGARNMETREQALRKFGYEKYIKEGFKKGKIAKVTVDKDVVILDNTTYCHIGARDKVPPLTRKFNPRYNHDEKLIFMENGITFLQVKDTSTGKTYFLKVPPTMQSVREAKAWTFGLNPRVYNPVIET